MTLADRLESRRQPDSTSRADGQGGTQQAVVVGSAAGTAPSTGAGVQPNAHRGGTPYCLPRSSSPGVGSVSDSEPSRTTFWAAPRRNSMPWGATHTEHQLAAAVLRQDGTTQLVVLAAQAVVVLVHWRKSQADFFVKVQPVVVLLMLVLGWVIMTRWPKFYISNRTWLLPILRVLVCVVPSARQVGVGTAVIMERPPEPGLRGALLDALRVTTGIRLLPLAAHSCFQLLPPFMALATQACLTALTWNSAGYCTTELLSSPLSRERQLAAAVMLEYAAWPLAAVQPVAGFLLPSSRIVSGHGVDEQAICHATMSLLHLTLGLLLPLALAVYNWRTPSQRDQQQGQQGHSTCNWRAVLGKRVAIADRWLYYALGGQASAFLRCLVHWYVLANCWLLAKVWVGF